MKTQQKELAGSFRLQIRKLTRRHLDVPIVVFPLKHLSFICMIIMPWYSIYTQRYRYIPIFRKPCRVASLTKNGGKCTLASSPFFISFGGRTSRHVLMQKEYHRTHHDTASDSVGSEFLPRSLVHTRFAIPIRPLTLDLCASMPLTPDFRKQNQYFCHFLLPLAPHMSVCWPFQLQPLGTCNLSMIGLLDISLESCCLGFMKISETNQKTLFLKVKGIDSWGALNR